MNRKLRVNQLSAVIASAFGLAVLAAGCDRTPTTSAPTTTTSTTTTPATTSPPSTAATASAAPATTPATTTAAPATTPATTTAAGSAAAPSETVSVADITGNAANYQGKAVTVIADVQEVKGPRAFTLDEDAPLRGGIDNDLLVLSPKAGSLVDIDDKWKNNKVSVTGVVHRFVAVEIEREIGWDLDRRIEAEFEGKRPVLIATSVERVGDKKASRRPGLIATTASGSDMSAAPSETAVRAAQRALNGKGFDAGAVDGEWGPNTEAAVRRYQEANKLPTTGKLDGATRSSLGISS